ncbi:helix-turn-helix transcriptional regulator [Clostridium sp.]
MGRVNNALAMVFLLKCNGKMKIKDLSEKLEVSERQIRRYKEDLEGIFNIEATKGPDGGYVLMDDYFPFREILTENEINELNLALNSLDENLFKESSSLKKAIGKINFSIVKKDEEQIFNEQIIPYSRPKSSLGNEIIKMHDEIYAAIISCYEIEITYLDNKGSITERRIRPHKYLRYKGEYYLVATCLLKNEIRYFKIVRIKSYFITKDKFERNIEIEDILRRDRENSLGIFHGNTYALELEISSPMSNTISERIWVDNQHIDFLEKGKILFRATMAGGPELIAWILSMGEAVKIIAPESLKEEIKKKLEKMLKNI